jgi:hypothetical protein
MLSGDVIIGMDETLIFHADLIRRLIQTPSIQELGADRLNILEKLLLRLKTALTNRPVQGRPA